MIIDVDVAKVAAKLQKIIKRPEGRSATKKTEVATDRKLFWANFGPKQPTQIIITDGLLRQYPDPQEIGVMEYEAVGEPTYLLIVEYNEENKRWVIVYAYFFHENQLDTEQLLHQLRLFHASDLSAKELEQILHS